MSEAQFAKSVLQLLDLHGRRVLRVADHKEAIGGLYGLRALTRPIIKSSGADYLVLPRAGIPTHVVRDLSVVRFVAPGDGVCFLELKDPMAAKRSQPEQQRWIDWVGAR